MSELPKGWVNTELEKIITPSKKKLQPEEFQDLVYLSLKHIDADSNFINGSGDVSSVKSTKSRFYAGDVLYGRLRPYLNKVCMPDFEGVCSTEILIFSPSSGLYNPFLKHYLSSAEFVDYASSNSKGINLPRISQKEIDKKSVNLPPLNEQKRIADKLDQVLKEVNSAKSRLDQIPTILKNFRQSVLNKLFDEIKKGSNDAKLKKLTTKIGSGSTPKGGKGAYQETGVPLIRSMNIRMLSFKDKGLAFINDDQAHKLNSSTTEENDVLLNITGASIGRVSTCPNEMIGARVNQHVCIIRSNKDILNPHFLALYLASPYIQTFINEENYGATRQALTKSMIEDIRIPVPSIDQQDVLVKNVQNLFLIAEKIESKYNLAIENVDKITQSVLAKAFCGELVPQNPNDEPASVLLERIKAEKELQKLIPKQKRQKTIQKNQEIKKMILSVLDTLKKEKEPLTAQNLLQKSGYPIDSDPEEIEKFFLDIRNSLNEGTIIRERVEDEDIFRLAA